MDTVMKGLMAAMPRPQNFWARTAPNYLCSPKKRWPQKERQLSGHFKENLTGGPVVGQISDL